jgi:hypothetical protein
MTGHGRSAAGLQAKDPGGSATSQRNAQMQMPVPAGVAISGDTPTYSWGYIETQWWGFIVHLTSDGVTNFNIIIDSIATAIGTLAKFPSYVTPFGKVIATVLAARTLLNDQLSKFSRDGGLRMYSFWPTPLMLFPMPEPPYIGDIGSVDRAELKSISYAVDDGWGGNSWYAGKSIANSRPAVTAYSDDEMLAIAYRGQDQGNPNQLYYADYNPARQSTVDQPNGWSDPEPIGTPYAKSEKGVALAASPADDGFYVVCRGVGEDDSLYWIHRIDGPFLFAWKGGKISFQDGLSPHSTNDSPAMARDANGVLHIAYRDGYNKKLHYIQYDGDRWFDQGVAQNCDMYAGPALAFYYSKLYAVYPGADWQLYYTVYDVGSGWRSPTPMANMYTVAEPALAYFGGKLYCAARGGTSDPKVYWTRYDQPNWSRYTPIPGTSSDAGPALVNYKDPYAPNPDPTAPDPAKRYPPLLTLIHQGGTATS